MGTPVEFAGETATILDAQIHRLACLRVNDFCYLTFRGQLSQKMLREMVSLSTHVCCIESTAKKTRTTGL